MSEINAVHESTRTEVADYLRELADQLDTRESDPLTGGLYSESESETGTGTGTETGTETGTGTGTETGTTGTETGTETGTGTGTGTGTETGTGTGTRTSEKQTETSTPSTSAETSTRTTAETQSSRDGKVTFLVGNDSATINPPENVSFGIDVNSDETLISGEEERYVELTLQWDPSEVAEDDTLEIE